MRRRTIVFALVALATGTWATGCSSEPPPLDLAIDIAGDEGEFGNGPEAGESMARIAQHLDAAIADCNREEEAGRCASLNVASGYARVLAVQVLTCTAPGRFEARTAMLELLDAIDSLSVDATKPPEPAPLPDCS